MLTKYTSVAVVRYNKKLLGMFKFLTGEGLHIILMSTCVIGGVIQV